MKRRFAIFSALVAGLVYAGAAQAATATLSGSAVIEGDHVKIVSNYSDDPGNTGNNGGAVAFTGTGVTTFDSIKTLSADFNVTDDACLGGSPRLEIDFAGTMNNMFVYLGTHNAVTGQFDCTANVWISSGNLVVGNAPRFDLTKFGGPFYGTHAQAKALVGVLSVDEIRFVVDGGWAFADKEQTVLLRTATINEHVFTFKQPPGMINPAQACRALRAQVGTTNFVNMWGTNANKRNAFGKCVSHMAKLQSQAAAFARDACKVKSKKGGEHKACAAAKAKAKFNAKRAALTAAVATCAAEKKASPSAFLARYGKRNARAAFAACVRSKD